jgi:hypothetical protein
LINWIWIYCHHFVKKILWVWKYKSLFSCQFRLIHYTGIWPTQQLFLIFIFIIVIYWQYLYVRILTLNLQ